MHKFPSKCSAARNLYQMHEPATANNLLPNKSWSVLRHT